MALATEVEDRPCVPSDVRDCEGRGTVQLLLLSVLQAPVVENHTHHALWAQEGAAAFGNQLPPLGQANLASLSLTFPPTRRGQKDLE